MRVLHELYKLNPEDTRYRSKLKSRLLNMYKESITFLKPQKNQAEIVINTDVLVEHNTEVNSTNCLRKAAEYLRDDIIRFASSLPNCSWPPLVDELISESRNPPSTVTDFLTHLLKPEKHNLKRSDNLARLVDSYAADLVYSVSRGKVTTAKHVLLATGLHNMTGQRNIIEIVNKLGHCISYNLTCEIETAQAVRAQYLATKNNSLPIRPSTDSSTVLTVFWVDNFDITVEKQSGRGSVNTTHLVAFQELSDQCYSAVEFPTIERTNKRKLDLPETPRVPVNINVKAEPPTLPVSENISTSALNHIDDDYFIWCWTRKENSFDQLLSSFSGWLLKQRGNNNLIKTEMTYLPPIASKVTEFSTIVTYMDYLQKLAREVNMPYVNITLDIGAAINAYKVLWNRRDQFANIVIHPGDFHFMKENFQVRKHSVISIYM